MEGLIEGRLVHYIISSLDAEEINRRRLAGEITKSRMHVGNRVMAGEHFPAIIVRLFHNEFGDGEHGVNLQVFLDGNDTLWKTSVRYAKPDEILFNTWHWIERQ